MFNKRGIGKTWKTRKDTNEELSLAFLEQDVYRSYCLVLNVIGEDRPAAKSFPGFDKDFAVRGLSGLAIEFLDLRVNEFGNQEGFFEDRNGKVSNLAEKRLPCYLVSSRQGPWFDLGRRVSWLRGTEFLIWHEAALVPQLDT